MLSFKLLSVLYKKGSGPRQWAKAWRVTENAVQHTTYSFKLVWLFLPKFRYYIRATFSACYFLHISSNRGSC